MQFHSLFAIISLLWPASVLGGLPSGVPLVADGTLHCTAGFDLGINDGCVSLYVTIQTMLDGGYAYAKFGTESEGILGLIRLLESPHGWYQQERINDNQILKQDKACAPLQFQVCIKAAASITSLPIKVFVRT